MVEVVVPTPGLPTASVIPELVKVMTLVVASIVDVGVKIAVQVKPPLVLVTALNVPFALVNKRSSLVKPLTTSLNVMVTKAVSPIFNAVSDTVMVAVGAKVSTTCTLGSATVLLLLAPSWATPAATDTVMSPVKPAVGVTNKV